jgi:hypothetical protein
MPFFAVTGPPWGPVVGITEADALDELAALTAGAVAPAPSRISTCPLGTEALAVVVAPNIAAIVRALAAAPLPYSTPVMDRGLVSPIWPAR